MKEEFNDYRTLFNATFKLSMFTFGGGYVIVPLMKKRFVEELKWIDEDEMLDMIAIAQSAPGVIATNTSIILGYQLAGFKGAIIATTGTVLPPFIIISIITFFYQAFSNNELIRLMLEGMNAGVAAMILDTSITMLLDNLKINKSFNLILFIVAFCLTYFLRINVAFIILFSIILGIIISTSKLKVLK